MSPWHTRCSDDRCYLWCQRPDCQEPGVHFLAKSVRQGNKWVTLHRYDCALSQSLARQVVEELRPGMAPDEIAIARRVLIEALDKLEQGERRRPVIVRESA